MVIITPVTGTLWRTLLGRRYIKQESKGENSETRTTVLAGSDKQCACGDPKKMRGLLVSVAYEEATMCQAF